MTAKKNNLRLQKLVLKGFRSWKDEAEFNFPTSGPILFTGYDKVNNTGSGTGKSSILEAIAFALGYCNLPSTILKNWDSKSMSVVLTITDDVNEYIIARDPKLKITENGVLNPKETSAGFEIKLKEILGIPKDLVEALVYRPQRQNGRFIHFTDSKKKDFLTACLQLKEIEDAYEQFDSELKSLTVNKSIIQNEIEFVKTMINDTTVNSQDIDSAQIQHQAAFKKLEEVRSVSVDPAIQQEISRNTEDLQRINNSMMLAQNAYSENIRIETTLTSLKSELKSLMDNICPTCNRDWDNSTDIKQIKKKEYISLTSELVKNTTIIKETEPLVEQKNQITKRSEDLQSKVMIAKSLISQAEQTETISRSFLSNLQNQVEVHKKHVESLGQKSTSLTNSDYQLSLTGYAKDLLGRNGFLGEIFDEVLLDIQNRTNEMIGMIPNVSRFVMKLSSSRLTQSGNKKKEIKSTFYKKGQEIPFKALSGGQQVSVELCADLAVAQVIRDRSGSRLGWIALDEAMDGLDIEPKKAALDVIKQKTKGQILIIDHATEIKEGFSTVFNVVFDGDYSSVDV